LTKPGWLVPTTLVSARLQILKDGKNPLKHNAERSFYVLAAEATAKIRLLESEAIKPGENGWAQLMLDRPLAIVDGDHFIIRSTTETLGGGVIVDAHARRMPRFKPEVIKTLNVREKGSPEDLVVARLAAKNGWKWGTVDTNCLIFGRCKTVYGRFSSTR